VRKSKKRNWSIATRRGCEKVKKRNWSIATRRGREKEKKRKDKDQGRQEGGSSKGKVPMPYTKNFFFLVQEYLGLKAARLGRSISTYETWSTRKPCAKEVPETDYFTQRKEYLKRTTLRRLKIPLRRIVVRKVHTIALEQSVKKAVMRHATNAIWHGDVKNPTAKYS
jgi:hypothetical protein